MLRCSLFVFVIILVGLDNATAQNSRRVQQSQVFLDYGDRFFGEAIVVPRSSDTASLLVLFRMANEFLSFVKVTDRTDLGGNFKADVSVSIEVRDSIGVIRHRLPWKGTAYANTFEQTNSKTDFTFGWATLALVQGKYRVTLEILAQKESSQKRIVLPDVEFFPQRERLPVALPLIAESVESEDEVLLSPYVFGGSVPFQTRDADALILVRDSVAAVYDMRIDQQPYDDKAIRWWMVGDVEGVATSSPGLLPEISSLSTSQRPTVRLRATNHASISSIRVRIPVTQMVPGKYVIHLVKRGGKDTISIPVSVYWEMMPLSLRNLNYAINIARYVLSDSLHDEINDGTDADRRDKLMRYWRDRDPSPSTTYNEQLHEYYKRVDQSFYAYSTIQEPDGARSDRGKIYILHGAPTATKKSLSPQDKPQEVWTFDNKVNSVFTFELDDSGAYRLKAIRAAK